MEYFNSFGGNPVSSTIGHEVLKIIKDEDLQKNAKNVKTYKAELIRSQSTTYTKQQSKQTRNNPIVSIPALDNHIKTFGEVRPPIETILGVHKTS